MALGNLLYNARQTYRNVVPQSVRKGIRDYTGYGMAYKGAQKSGLGQALLPSSQTAAPAQPVGQSTIWQTGGWPDQATYDNWVANGGDSMLTYQQAQEQVAGQMTQQQTTSGGGGGGGTTPAPVEQPWQAVYNGQIYGDIGSYSNAVNEDINKKFNDAKKVIDQNYQNGIINLDTRNSQIEATRTNLAQQHSTNLGNVQGTFSKLSPEALQSAQGDYENKINTSFDQANTKLGTLPQNYRTMSPEQLSQYSDPTNANYLTESGGLARDYANLTKSYTTNQQGATDWATSQKNNIIGNFLSASDAAYANNQPEVASKMSDFANYFAGMQFTPMQGMAGATPQFAQVANDPNKKKEVGITSYANA